MDLTKTIIPKSDQLNADDLIAGPKTIKIREIRAGSDETQPVNIYFDGDGGKPYRPCKSMRRVLVQLWGANSDVYIGRSLTLYRDESVTWAGVSVGGIRISHASHIAKPTKVLITNAKNKRTPFEIGVISLPTLPELTEQHPKFESVAKSLKDKTQSLETVKQYFALSTEMENYLKSL